MDIKVHAADNDSRAVQQVHSGRDNLGGQVVLQVAPRGAEPKWQAATEGLHRGPLQVEVPPNELGSLQEFDVQILLRSSSGSNTAPKPAPHCAL
jgi:hypothetical protein